MEGLECTRTYFDGLLCISKGHFNKHLEDVRKVLVRSQKANRKVNMSKLSFGTTKIEYLGNVVTRNGIIKIEAIQTIL